MALQNAKSRLIFMKLAATLRANHKTDGPESVGPDADLPHAGSISAMRSLSRDWSTKTRTPASFGHQESHIFLHQLQSASFMSQPREERHSNVSVLSLSSVLQSVKSLSSPPSPVSSWVSTMTRKSSASNMQRMNAQPGTHRLPVFRNSQRCMADMLGLTPDSPMDLETFKHSLKAVGANLSPTEAMSIFGMLDHDNSGVITLAEFVTTLMAAAPRMTPEEHDHAMRLAREVSVLDCDETAGVNSVQRSFTSSLATLDREDAKSIGSDSGTCPWGLERADTPPCEPPQSQSCTPLAL